MAKRLAKFPYLHTYKDVRGKQRAYFSRPGFKKIPLPLPVGSPAFVLAYAEASNSVGIEKTKTVAPLSDSFNALLQSYYRSALFINLAPSTKISYRRILEGFCEKFGNLPISQFERVHAQRLLAQMSDRPEAANGLQKRLNTLLNYAVDISVLKHNPMSGITPYKASEEGHHSWTDEEIDQFIGRHPFGTKAYLALQLLLMTGQRKSDIVRMGWKDIRDGRIVLKQQKTRADLMLPIMGNLLEAIQREPKENPCFLMTEQGKPFSAAGFGNWMRNRCDEANLPQCSSHGLRKACSRRLAEAGCSTIEIQSITGHKTEAEVRRYTRMADQKRIATQAIEKLENNVRNNHFANTLADVSRSKA